MKKHRHLSRLLYGVMKISLYQLFIAFIFASISAAGTVGAQDVLNQKVTIQVNNQEIKTVLTKLNKLTQIRFTYSSALIRAQQKVSINAVDRPLGDVLNELFKPINITYKIEGKQVVLVKSTPEPGSCLTCE
jgi:type II secretory pathway component GspD/PulD (secretin)